jgi:hypothetical protein
MIDAAFRRQRGQLLDYPPGERDAVDGTLLCGVVEQLTALATERGVDHPFGERE